MKKKTTFADLELAIKNLNDIISEFKRIPDRYTVKKREKGKAGLYSFTEGDEGSCRLNISGDYRLIECYLWGFTSGFEERLKEMK